MNVLCLGARVIGVELAVECCRAFLGARSPASRATSGALRKVQEIEAEEG